jgi:hypothetical protein
MYSEGDKLRSSLIDMKRTFNLVMHLKSVKEEKGISVEDALKNYSSAGLLS